MNNFLYPYVDDRLRRSKILQATDEPLSPKNAILVIFDESEALQFQRQDGSYPKGIEILRDRNNPTKTQRRLKYKEESERAERIFNEPITPLEPYVYVFNSMDCIIPA